MLFYVTPRREEHRPDRRNCWAQVTIAQGVLFVFGVTQHLIEIEEYAYEVGANVMV